jgi:phosphoribosylglycinamide formyltransferase-1
MEKLRLGVLVSGKGTNLQAIIEEIASGKLDAEIKIVLSNRRDAYALCRAENAGIKNMFVDINDFPNNEAYHQRLIDLLEEQQVDLVILAGYMRILNRTFVERFRGRILNIHPSLLPAFPGLHAVEQALEKGVKVTGCTVHFVDEGVDSGPILLQKAVEISEGETVESLTAKIQQEEHRLFPAAIRKIAEGEIPLPFEMK